MNFFNSTSSEQKIENPSEERLLQQKNMRSKLK